MSTAAPHAWLRRVSDYHSGSVSATERAAVEAHLAECAECRLALAAYRHLYTLARSPLRLGDGGAGALMDYQPMLLEEIMLTTDRDTRNIATRPPRRTALTALGAIAAVLVIALLAATLFAHFRAPTQPVTPRPTATPALDPQSQAYVTLLRTYYVPVYSAGVTETPCAILVENTRKLSDLLTCRPLFAAQLAATQTLRTQLATATPPVRWQTQHTALQQAVQEFIAFETDELAAIDAHDITRYFSLETRGIDVTNSLCQVITQVNAGPPPLSPALSTFC